MLIARNHIFCELCSRKFLFLQGFPFDLSATWTQCSLNMCLQNYRKLFCIFLDILLKNGNFVNFWGKLRKIWKGQLYYFFSQNKSPFWEKSLYSFVDTCLRNVCIEFYDYSTVNVWEIDFWKWPNIVRELHIFRGNSNIYIYI